MSYFGNGTPQQQLLDAAKGVQFDFQLTDEELVQLLAQVLRAVMDPFDSKVDALGCRRKNDQDR